METIQTGQTYSAGEDTRRPVWWRILSISEDTAYATRVRKADGRTWVWDEDNGRDFRLDIIRKHWTLIG